MTVIAPGAVLGVLGGGQLGRMFAIAARRLGYRVHVLSPDDDTPTGQVADVEITAPYEDLDAVERFARGIAALTFEFENVPSSTADAAARHTVVRPAGRVLHITQHRIREKSFLRECGLPVTPFAPVRSSAELVDALAVLGTPAVLKTASWGYDGKGQEKVLSLAEAGAAWARLGSQEAILEAFIDFSCELSVIAVRSVTGEVVHYGPISNTHRNHVLDVSLLPAPIDPGIARQAIDIARAVVECLDLTGVLCIEFFLDRSDRLLINELAPRPHNSGHLTIDGCSSCQFQQQVRAVCGLPLGSTHQHRPAAMVNLMGELWHHGAPNWPLALAVPDVSLHLYGKAEPRPGRKMGHLTALADQVEVASARALAARSALLSPPDP